MNPFALAIAMTVIMSDEKHPPLKRYRRAKVFGLCLGAGIIGFLVWSVFAGKDMDLFVPVDVADLPPGLALAGLPLKEVEVRVRGPKHLLRSLSGADYRYAIDTTDMSIGINRFPLQEDRFGFAEGISISRIHPATLILRVEKAVTKQVPVMVTLSGKPAAGYRIADAVARPSSVTLSGPESVLLPLEKAMTESIDISGISESVKKEIALNLAETLSIESSSDMFHAEIYLAERIVSKAFRDISVEGIGTHLDHTITPQTIHIEISGPMKVLERMDAGEDIRAYVDLKALEPGVYVRAASISLPLKTTLVSVDPEIFSVTIR